ncbi:S9 family peptidase [Pseudoxanthomonas sacheonensis]|uniref:S9 family peptidase n=1 Tax=Pseudoxanthomonas sacheonensis TaxID=443615 RepID=UPI0013D53E88|nr:S9 family peptidase [Pseudoxanthomonas sacheonensis]KAF1711671.1 hypothetical protein CSC73_02675 [Pseudoxanthomonas sacheonensis]
MKVFSRLLLLLLLVPSVLMAREVPIRDFFKDPEFRSVRLSPDGKHMSVIIPQGDRSILAVLQVSDRKVIGKWDYGENRHFEEVLWVNNDRLLFWVGFKLGSFDFKIAKGDLYASNIDGTGRLDIENGAFYSIVDTTPADRETVLVQRSVDSAFLFKLNVYNGRITTVATAPVDGGGFLVDHDLKVRYAVGSMNDGRQVTLRKDGEKWTKIHESERSGETFRPIGFAADNKHVYFAKSKDGKPSSIVLLDPETQEETAVAANPNVSASGAIWSSDDKTLLALEFEDGLPYIEFVNKDHPEAKILAGLVNAFPGKAISYSGTSDDGRYFLVYAYSDRDPGEVYLYDSQTKKAAYLLSAMDWIKPEEMSSMKPVSVKARDGLTLHGYLTVPAGSTGKNLPLIINPHGGPHGVRDSWGFNPEVQLLANRGYAVLQINYRGSGGYGGAFERAGYRKWGTAMQDDLTDSVQWAIREGVADPGRVCIYGASYGGYAALMSVVREPDLYKCTVGYVGVYDLDIQRDADFADHVSGRNYLKDVYPVSKAERVAQSPGYHADRIKAGIMLVHGAKDIRVPIRNMYFLIDQLEKAGKKPDDVVVEKKEQHGFRDLENNVNLYTKMLVFFDKYIGPASASTQVAK